MKPQLLLTLLAAALVALVLPLASSARVDSDGGLPTASTVSQPADDDADETEAEDADDDDVDADDDELEHEGTLTLNTDSVLVTDEHGGVTSCAVPTGLDLSAFAGQDVEIKCEQVNGVWTVARVKSEDGETEVEVGDVDNSGPGNADDEDEDNSGPGHLDDDDSSDDSPSLDDNDDDHSGPGGGGDDDEEDDD